jgi:hypothetical protein
MTSVGFALPILVHINYKNAVATMVAVTTTTCKPSQIH